MQIVRFTKFWSHLSPADMAERALALGYDGLDLAVRPGSPIHPDHLAALPAAVSAWRTAGLACPLLSAVPELVDPQDPGTIALYRAAAAAGVPAIKIGYFVYRPGCDLEATWDAARTALAGFQRLSRSTGVRTLCHTHSGLCLGSNCSGLRHLLADCDPAWVGAYVDLGHLAVNGEDVRLGLPMVRAHLAAVAAKDARHQLRGEAGSPPYQDAFVLLGEGAAQIQAAMGMLRAWRFRGPVSVHTEYTADPRVLATVGGRDDSEAAHALRRRGEVADLAYLRSCLAAGGRSARLE